MTLGGSSNLYDLNRLKMRKFSAVSGNGGGLSNYSPGGSTIGGWGGPGKGHHISQSDYTIYIYGSGDCNGYFSGIGGGVAEKVDGPQVIPESNGGLCHNALVILGATQVCHISFLR